MVEGYQIQFFEPPLIRVFDLISFGLDKMFDLIYRFICGRNE